MSYWNHRVMRRTVKTVVNGQDFGDETFDAVYEVYYNDDGSIEGWTQDPTSPLADVPGDNGSSIEDDIARFLVACKRPTLDWETGKEIDNESR